MRYIRFFVGAAIAIVILFSFGSTVFAQTEQNAGEATSASQVKKKSQVAKKASPPVASRRKYGNGSGGSGSPNWDGPTPRVNNTIPREQMTHVGGPNVGRKVDGAYVSGDAAVISYRDDSGNEGKVLSFSGGPQIPRGPVIKVGGRYALVTRVE